MTLGRNSIHVWHIDLDDARWDAWAWVLDDSERTKALHYYSDAFQARSRRCRSALRRILAHYAEIAPDALRLALSRFGKVTLEGFSLHFNVAHTEGWALVAVAPEPVGVDIEPAYRPDITVADIAAVACHQQEAAALQALPPRAAGEALMRLWTQKEAYVKALGTGLQHTLTSVRVLPGGRAGLARIVDEAADASGPYFIHTLEAPAHCVASLCTHMPDVVVRSCGLAHADSGDGDQLLHC